MKNTTNYEGIVSKDWRKFPSTEVSDGIFEYILWRGEEGKQTEIYKFEKNTKFNAIDFHSHGEEHVFVISGVFQDGKNSYKEGSYVTLPQGTAHIPQSEEGCVVLVTFPNGRKGLKYKIKGTG